MGSIGDPIPTKLQSQLNDKQVLKVVASWCQVHPSDIEKISPCFISKHYLQDRASVVYPLKPGIDIARIKEAWKRCVQQNELLRSRLVLMDGESYCQVVLRPEVDNIPPRELPGFSSRPVVELVDVCFIEDPQAAGVYALHLSAHSIVSKVSIIRPIIASLDALYCKSLVELPQCRVSNQTIEEFWRKELEGVDVGQFPPISKNHTVLANNDLSRSWSCRNVSPVHLYLAWSLVLAQFSNTQDVIFGISSDLPSDSALPLLVRLGQNKQVDATLNTINLRVRDLSHHQKAGVSLIRSGNVETKRAFDFQTQVIVHRTPANLASLLFPENSRSPYTGNLLDKAVNVICQIREGTEEVEATLVYDPVLMPAIVASRFLEYLEILVQHISGGLAKEINQLPSLPGSDLDQIRAWNATPPTTYEACTHELIQQHIMKSPQSISVHAWDGILTYADLGNLSNSIASQLIQKGVCQEDFIPICCEKSYWVIVAILGVLKSGAAFVLMDPSFPPERLRTIAQICKAKLIISSTGQESLTQSIGSDFLIIGPLDPTSAYSLVLPTQRTMPGHAMYAAFTSGSTGTPKGVVIEHRSFLSGAVTHNKSHHVDMNSRVLHFSSNAFDTMIMETMSTLSAGGCVCIPSESDRKENLSSVIANLQVTHAILTPSVCRLLDPEVVQCLRVLVLVGESMSRSDLELWAPRVCLLNEYGPAECSIGSTVSEQLTVASNPNNIGRAIGGATWVVNQDDPNYLVPIGAVGELLVEGPTVGRGYLGQPESLTGPFLSNVAWMKSLRPGTKQHRMYRTGDLVQYSEDGSLILVGRKDSQIKIQGQRVELSEVEYHIRSCFDNAHQAVAEIVRLGLESSPKPVIIAFIDMHDILGTAVDDPRSPLLIPPTQLFSRKAAMARSVLEHLLPRYMVPSFLLPVRDIPQTPTGKVDRKRLREEVSNMSQYDLSQWEVIGEEIHPCQTPNELVLQDLFAHILNVPPSDVQAKSHFLRLGGDSLAAIQMVAAARDEGYVLTVPMILSSPQLDQLAKKLEQTLQGTETKVPDPYELLAPYGNPDDLIPIAAEQCQVSANDIEDLYPCTPFQEGIMAGSLNQVGMYIVRSEYKCNPGVDCRLLELAWQKTVQANPILRTRVVSVGAHGLFQVVLKTENSWIQGHRRDLDVSSKTELLGELGKPMIQLSVVTKSTPNATLRIRFTIHHALCDGWSIPLIWNQVEKAYHGYSLPMRPFSPFVAHLMNKEGPINFWGSQFKDLSAPTFPTTPPNYVASPSASFHHTIQLEPPKAMSHTLSTLIRFAFAFVISQYTDTPDVVYGLTLNGRCSPICNIDNITGPTVATVPFRVSMGSPTEIVESILDQIQDRITAMAAYEQVGLANISRLSPEAARASAFQFHLGVQQPDQPFAPTLLEQDTTGAPDDYRDFASYAMVVLCHLPNDLEQGVKIAVNFDPAIVEPDLLERMILQFENVLQQVCKHPTQTLSQLDGLSSYDWKSLEAWNRDLPVSCTECVHDMVLKHSKSQPQKTAVSSWDGEWTYQDLDIWSYKLAQYLKTKGAGPGFKVPICMSKSKWAPIAILGTLRSGSACVLIDPSHPRTRVMEIINQLESKLTLASPENAELLRCTGVEQVLVPDELFDLPAKSLNSLDPLAVIPTDIAFIIFTSGSTGQPKGIVTEHSSLATSLRDHAAAMGITPDSRTSHFASYAFDASIYEVLTTLATGGCLCIPSTSDSFNNREGFIREFDVNTTILTPSSLTILDPDAVPSLKTIVLGGEAVMQQNVETWAHRVRLINGYGPAEATICAGGDIPITGWKQGTFGRMLGSVSWIVSPSNVHQLAPIGTVGELLIEGPVLARCYHNNPKATAASFIRAPDWLSRFRGSKDSRVYRTGDLVQYNHDGTLRFVGRKDQQVKLRGQRIELGEVETHSRRVFLDGSLTVIAEVGTPKGPPHDRAALIVFVCSSDGQRIEEQPLLLKPTDRFCQAATTALEQLRNIVPAYMVPSTFLPIGTVPHTPTGKIDRKSLRALIASFSWQDLDLKTVNTAPTRLALSTKAELKLQGIWAKVLGLPLDRIAGHDNFFHLGGDSILIMTLVQQVQRLGSKITAADVFSRPTLAELAGILDL